MFIGSDGQKETGTSQLVNAPKSPVETPEASSANIPVDNSISQSEVSVNTDEGLIYETLVQMGVHKGAAQSLARQFDAADGLSAEVYAKGVGESFLYGMMNFSEQELHSAQGFAADLSALRRKSIYDFGKTFTKNQTATEDAKLQQQKNTAKKNPKKKGRVHYEVADADIAQLTERQKTSIKALEKLANALGVDFYLYRSEKNAQGKPIGENGWYDPKTGDIHIDIDAGENGAGTILFTAAHELSHFLHGWAPYKFKILADFLVEQYGAKGQSVADLIRAQQAKAKGNGRHLTWMQAYEEMVADSMETMLTDGKVMEKLTLLKKKDMGLVQKIKEWFRDFAAKLRRAYETAAPDTREGQMVAEMVDEIDRIQELFAEGLAEAGARYKVLHGQKNNASEGEALYSLREFEDGIRFVDVQVDTHVFAGMTVAQMNKAVKPILMERFAGKVIGIDHRVFVNGDSVNEYLHPSKSIDVDTRKVKLAAAGELDNLVDAGIALPNEPDGRDGHIHPDTIDFSYFKTIFKVGNEYFEGLVNIKNIKRGKLFKDVTQIKNITQDIVSSYGLNPKSNFLRDASMNSIRNSEPNVNPKNSQSDVEDQKYLSVVQKGDMETAQRMVDEAAERAGYTNSEDWRMDHRAPTSKDDTAHSLDQIDKAYGGDGSIYSPKAAYYYGEYRSYDHKAISVIRSAKNNPDKIVTIYRAVPTDIQDTRVRNGDWVAIVKEYAQEHGERMFDEDFRIIENRVPAKHLYGNGDSINEWGYDNGDQTEVYKNVPGNVKLAAVTYDDEGDVIPLSERFDPDNTDIRYSDRGNISTRSILTELDASAVTNEIERKHLLDYQEKSSRQLAEQKKLRQLQKDLKDLESVQGKKDVKRIRFLKDEKIKTENRIKNYEGMLRREEYGKHLEGLIHREVKTALAIAVEKYGAIPTGERAAADRSVAIPVRMNKETKVSRVARSAAEAEMTPKEFVPYIEQAVVDGLLSYDPDTNKKQMERAQKWLEYNGFLFIQMFLRFFCPESDSGFGTFSHPPRRRLLSHFSHKPNCIGLYPKNRL